MGNKHVECNRCGTSSVLKKSVTYVRLAQLDRAFGYGPKGRGFESSSARFFCAYARFFALCVCFLVGGNADKMSISAFFF